MTVLEFVSHSLVEARVETRLTDLSTAPVTKPFRLLIRADCLHPEDYSTRGLLLPNELLAHKESLFLTVFLPGDLIIVIRYLMIT